MKGLVIKNPWLWCTTRAAVDPQAKTVENRGWSTSYRGDVALIEGRALDNAVWDGPYAPLVVGCRQRWWETRPVGMQIGPWPWETARGAVVAVARLAGVCTGVQRELGRCSPWAFPSACHWQWEDIRPLPVPVPVKGWQRLRDLPADVEVAVREQLGVPA